MAKYECQDHYRDSETGVLKNKLGINDENELKKAEASLAAWRSFQLADKPIRGHFDLDHLKAIHTDATLAFLGTYFAYGALMI